MPLKLARTPARWGPWMKRSPHAPALMASSMLIVAITVLALGIFVFDTVTDLEIAVAVFYVAVVLLCVGSFPSRRVVLISAGCMGLTLVSYLLTSSGSPKAGFLNCVISLSAIAATTYLALRIESAEVAAHEARAQLAHVARVTTLGELAASIAHEVNQPLAAIVTTGHACSRWLDAQPPNIERAHQGVERIIADANRASTIIKGVRTLARQAPARKEWVSLNEIILDIVTLTRNEMERHQITLRVELADDVPLVLGDHVQLQQVLLNLTINAIEAIEAAADPARELTIRSEKSETNGVQVTVGDTGAGLPIETSERLFQAFYTTKRDGMGMGLAVSHSIVEAHGGRIWAEENMPKGAVFRFTLPGIGKPPSTVEGATS